jgi:hypothetical protein
MAVFTALRNKAQSSAAGFLTKTAQSALGLNRAKGLRFNQPDSGPVTGNASTTRGGEVLQYPLDLGTDGNSHFIAFFVKSIKSPKAELASPEGDKESIKAVEALQNSVSTETEKDNTAQSKQIKKLNDAANSKVFGTGKSYLSIQEKTRPSTHLVKTIALYFPPSVQQTYSLSYNEQEISTEAAFGAEIIQGFMAKGFTADSFSDALDPLFAGIKTTVNKMGLAALDSIAAGSSSLIALNRGKVMAPKMEVMFENIGKRSFSYSFTFTPSSEQEADEVQSIIQAFRFHASSEYADGRGFELTIPDQFEIEYYTKNNQPNGYLHKIGTCVLESVDVTYGGDKMTWHETNSKGASPTKTTMALSFKELMTVTKSAIEDGF